MFNTKSTQNILKIYKKLMIYITINTKIYYTHSPQKEKKCRIKINMLHEKQNNIDDTMSN